MSNSSSVPRHDTRGTSPRTIPPRSRCCGAGRGKSRSPGSGRSRCNNGSTSGPGTGNGARWGRCAARRDSRVGACRDTWRRPGRLPPAPLRLGCRSPGPRNRLRRPRRGVPPAHDTARNRWSGPPPRDRPREEWRESWLCGSSSNAAHHRPRTSSYPGILPHRLAVVASPRRCPSRPLQGNGTTRSGPSVAGPVHPGQRRS